MRCSFAVLLVSFVTTVFAAAQSESSGPKIYPAAMSLDYNPLLWQGEDAQFALDMMHASHCVTEASKGVAAQTQNTAIQTTALTIAHEQGKLYRQLRSMARTLNFPLPRKRDLDDCPAAARISELSGRDMDSSYVTLLLETTALNVSRFEAEVARPRVPSNWTLWKLAEKNLPAIRSEESTVKDLKKTISNDN
jgi:predicted outer membrane protein